MARYSIEAAENRRLKNFEKWLMAAKSKHFDSFDYSLAKDSFKTQKAPVAIICKKHNVKFEVTAFDHLRFDGGGCSSCGNEKKADAKRRDGEAAFRAKFNASLSERLELKSDYLGMHEPITVFCKIHHATKTTTPNSLVHSEALGCDQCSRAAQAESSRWDLESILERFAPLLPDHVAIEALLRDTGSATKVILNCDQHGKSTVLVGYLTRSVQGKSHFCPRCGDEQTGYAGYRLKRLLQDGKQGKPTWLAVMEVEPYGIRTLKVGVSTRNLTDRYGPALKALHFTVRLDEREALLIENEVHRRFRSKHDQRIKFAGMRNGKRWAGDTECYWFDAKDDIVNLVKSRVTEIEAGIFNLEAASEAFVEPDLSVRDVSRLPGKFQDAIAVVCLDTGIRYESVTQAAAECGLSLGNISSVLNGKRRHAGGKRWVYAKDYDPSIPVLPLPSKNYRRLRVLCIEDNKVFDSLVEAGIAYGISSSHITSVCRGRRKSAGGKTWRYTE